jgi:molybdopterin/thiamine biosynthesis adenylyltransferase/proteasome lid subunit RPN8/RPN11
MTLILVMPSLLAEELEDAARHPLETGAVLFASVDQSESGTRILARGIRWMDNDAYMERETDSMSIKSTGYVPAIAEAEEIGAVGIWLHTHPGKNSAPIPSRADKKVDDEIADLFRLRAGTAYYGTLIISPRREGFVFTGKLEEEGNRTQDIDRVWIVGDRLRLIEQFEAPSAGVAPTFDRNVRAFGPAIQTVLGALHVGIVGCGGTGSAVAEQLTRLGVSSFTLVDPDVLSESNTTRVYGSTKEMVGIAKVEVVGKNIVAINPSAHVKKIRSTVLVQDVALQLRGCDVVFGCTDDNAGRLVLSRLATYFLVPVFDCGVLLTATPESRLIGIDGRVTTLVPGQACLVCRKRIDLKRAATEALTPEERVRRIDEGYAPALSGVEPAVVTFTTAVAATAVNEFLERLIGFGPEPRPSEILLRMHEREISTNRSDPLTGHYCSQSSGKTGLGMTSPFLEQMWLA